MSEKIHVLIADEDATLLDTLETLLSANHHIESVSACSTGIGLSDKVRRLRPDVVLLDLILPGVNGLSVLENLSAHPPRSRPTIFVMSSFVSPETAAECSRLGVSFYLHKPLDFTSLVDLIVRYGVHPRAGASSFFPNDPLLSLAITQLLTNYGFSQHMMGFRYIQDEVLYAIYNDTALDAVTRCSIHKSPKSTRPPGPAWNGISELRFKTLGSALAAISPVFPRILRPPAGNSCRCSPTALPSSGKSAAWPMARTTD